MPDFLDCLRIYTPHTPAHPLPTQGPFRNSLFKSALQKRSSKPFQNLNLRFAREEKNRTGPGPPRRKLQQQSTRRCKK